MYKDVKEFRTDRKTHIIKKKIAYNLLLPKILSLSEPTHRQLIYRNPLDGLLAYSDSQKNSLNIVNSIDFSLQYRSLFI